jgi:hypothetical protein
MTNGLTPCTGKNNNGLSYDKPVICLTSDPDIAESFAETADAISDDIFDSGIVVLAVNITDDMQLTIDPNIKQDDSDENISYVYDKIIPPKQIQILTETGERTE